MARVLMFSGGLDSFILKELYGFKEEECLFVHMGTQENEIEKEFLHKFFPSVQKTSLPISSYELDNKIIPYRNHYLALIGAQYATSIFFAFTSGDTTKDKDYVFKSQMEGVMNYFAQSIDKVRIPGPYEIMIPFKQLTKTQIVQKYIESGHPPIELLTKSYSCYAGQNISCGQCRSCLRKFIALQLNHINCAGYFFEIPARKKLIEFLKESEQKNRHEEIEDIKKCIEVLA